MPHDRVTISEIRSQMAAGLVRCGDTREKQAGQEKYGKYFVTGNRRKTATIVCILTGTDMPVSFRRFPAYGLMVVAVLQQKCKDEFIGPS